MKCLINVIAILLFFGSIDAMRVAPEPTNAQKGERFKKECAEHAAHQWAKKKEYAERIKSNNEAFEQSEIEQLVNAEITVVVQNAIKTTLIRIFPEAPLLKKPVALREWISNQAEKFLQHARAQERLDERSSCCLIC